MFSTFLRDLKSEFQDYSFSKLGKDALAGMTVCAVSLPLALAFGVSNGADAAAGLVTAIIASIVIGVFSGASFQISGPTGAMSAVLVSVVASGGMQGLFIVCFFAGLIRLLAGIFKLGRLINFIPDPVVMGFTSGIAIIIASSQINNFLGADIKNILSAGFHPGSVLIGLLTIAIMLVWPKKWGTYIPSSLVGIIVATLVSTLIKVDGLALVGDIPKTLMLNDRLMLSSFTPQMVITHISPIITIAALGMIETLLCGATAEKMTGQKYNSDRDLIAQGLGNMLVPLFGGVPATAAIARSSVAIKSGLQTRLAGIFQALFLLLSMFILGGVIAKLPLASLAGVLLVTSWRINEWKGIRFLFKKRFKTGISQYLITMLATVFFDLSVAILIGVIYSAIVHISVSGKISIDIAEVSRDRLSPGKSVRQGVDLSHIKVAYITGSVFFGAVADFNERLTKTENTEVLILSMRGVPNVDLSGAQAILDLCKSYREQNKSILFSGVSENVLIYLNRIGVTDLIGESSFFWSADRAIDSLIV